MLGTAKMYLCAQMQETGLNVTPLPPSVQLALAFGSEGALQSGRSFYKCGLCVDKGVGIFLFRFGDLESSCSLEEAS